MTPTGYVCRDPKASARDAAERFVATFWEWSEPRRIAEFLPDGRFRLVDGLRWYQVVPHDEGWQVLAE